jgi:diacylglycerol kinase (ATP)
LAQYALILNPITLKQHANRWRSLLALLHTAKVDYKIFETVSADAIVTETGKALKEGYTHILPIGGDGTLSLVVKAFMANDRNIYPDRIIIPLNFGTGHDFYNGFVPGGHRSDMSWILGDHELADVSVGSFGQGDRERYFVNSLSFGISHEVLSKRELSYFRQGKISYLLATMKAILSYRSQDLSISLDGVTKQKSTLLFLVSNGPYIGGGMNFVKKADPTSSTCEALWIPSLSILEIARHFPKIFQGRVAEVKVVDSFRFHHLHIKISGSNPQLEADGEICPVANEFELRILPLAIKMMRPRYS